MGVVGSPYGLKKIVLPQKSKKAVLDQIAGCGPESQGTVCFGDLPDRLKRYLHGELVVFNDKLDLAGTTCFQQSVWQAACNIPYGETRSYGWVARQLGLPKAARAVGQALARNPLPILIPCHRVIGSNGNLVGFGGGMKMKDFLLHLEQTTVN
ncbi:MAG: methylated-DNA--[protein]-cysteine S-methyltransferase [Chloroflexota bacterium]|nr:MAG: methylated-DNA--[protein]-cysteine S-methyltransferase [Chloroflexota bacterium]